ncbi:MAG: hypothetical protein ABIH83_00040 [Candidatus Micrarchaeota archaeon]
MNTVDVPEILLKRGKRICTSQDVREIVGKNYLPWISKLINTRWLMPLKGFRGVYYVLDPEERTRSFLKLDALALLASALNVGFGRNWYFGRVSALSLSGFIHQPVSVYYVLNSRVSRRIDSPIFGKVALLKTAAKITGGCGIISNKHKGIAYNICTLERGIADCLYLHVHGHGGMEQARNMLGGYGCSKKKIRAIILSCYPRHSAKKMLAALEK